MSIAASPSELYGEEYYTTSFNRKQAGTPYVRSAHWLNFFSIIADQIIRSRQPRRVLDVGCAKGFLVECFWDRGIYCEGIDVSEYAISQVRPDIRDYCRVASITDHTPGRFDVVTCIEVLEHIPPEFAESAVRNICQAADAVVFSSTPDDFVEPTHFNVRPPIYWLNLFAQFDFWPEARFDASFITPHAMLLSKGAPPPEDFLRLFSEYLRYKMAWQQASSNAERLQAEAKAAQESHEQTEQAHVFRIAKAEEHVSQLSNQLAVTEQDLRALAIQLDAERARTAELSSTAETLRQGRERENAWAASLTRELAASEQRRRNVEKDLEDKQAELEHALREFEELRQRSADDLEAKQAELQQAFNQSDFSRQQLATMLETKEAEVQATLRAAELERLRLQTTLDAVLNSRTWRLAERCRVPLRRFEGRWPAKLLRSVVSRLV